MQDDDEERIQRAARLKEVRSYRMVESGHKNTATEAARLLKVKRASYHQHENGHRKIEDARGRLYAEFFDVPVEWLMFGTNRPSYLPSMESHDSHRVIGETDSLSPRVYRIPTLREVRLLGLTHPANSFVAGGRIPMHHHVPYRGFRQDPDTLSSLQIDGGDDSVNQAYPPNTYVIIAPWDDIEPPRSGADVGLKVYIDGNEVFMVRRLVVADGIHYFHPISTNAAHTAFSERDYDLDIIGPVVEFYGKRGPGVGPRAKKKSFRQEEA